MLRLWKGIPEGFVINFLGTLSLIQSFTENADFLDMRTGSEKEGERVRVYAGFIEVDLCEARTDRDCWYETIRRVIRDEEVIRAKVEHTGRKTP